MKYAIGDLVWVLPPHGYWKSSWCKPGTIIAHGFISDGVHYEYEIKSWHGRAYIGRNEDGLEPAIDPDEYRDWQAGQSDSHAR